MQTLVKSIFMKLPAVIITVIKMWKNFRVIISLKSFLCCSFQTKNVPVVDKNTKTTPIVRKFLKSSKSEKTKERKRKAK